MTDTVEIRCATEAELPEIWRLAHDEYVRLGYINPQPGRIYIHYQHMECIEQTTRLVALVDGQVVGTFSYTVDGPAGLYCEVDFPREIRALRDAGEQIVSVWRIIVVDHAHRIASELMTEASRQIVELGEPTVGCVVHPRHVNYYVKRLGFERVAETKQTKGLAIAPGVLLLGRKGSYSRLLNIGK